MSWLVAVLFLPGLAALLIVGMQGRGKPGSRLGPVGWSFSDSWASNLTAVLAIFAALFGTDLLVQDPKISSDGYTVMSVTYGIALLVGPLVYVALSAPVRKDGNVQYQGYVYGFAAAAFITLWAVLGQLSLTLVLSTDVTSVHRALDLAISVFVVVALIAALAHAWVSTGFVFKELAENDETSTLFAEARAPRWPMP